jgi:flagellar P-ring protein precursor FlgI
MPAAATVRFLLNEPDYMSAQRLAAVVNGELQSEAAIVEDAGTITLRVPAEYQAAVPALIARLEPLQITVDAVARVVINERTGTIVLGGDVRLGPAAVAHGALSVRISTELQVSQPAPFSQGQTTVTPDTSISIHEGTQPMVALGEGTTLADVVKALNALGATPRDIIAIMQALKAAGALHADLVIL